MPKVKLIALDIDETILSKEDKISIGVRKAIKTAQDKGIKVVLATGRMHRAAMPIASDLNLDTPIISYQGALIKEFKTSSKTIFSCSIKENLAREAIHLLRETNAQVNVYLNDELHSEKENDRLEQYCKKQKVTYTKVASFDTFKEFEPCKILAIGNNKEETDEIQKKLRAHFKKELYIIKSTPVFCEINDNRISKGNAVLYLADKWGIKQTETMAVGDQNNDIEMLKAVHIKVAMGNATDELKSVANFITEDIANDGVRVAIEKFALNNEELECIK